MNRSRTRAGREQPSAGKRVRHLWVTLAAVLATSTASAGCGDDSQGGDGEGGSTSTTDSTDGSEGSGTAGPNTSTGSGSTTIDEPSTGGASCDTPEACAQDAEDATAAALEGLRKDLVGLREFLVLVPKGGDLHHHLSGSVYAETYMDWARAEGSEYCITTSSLSLSRSCGDGNDVPVPDGRDDLYLDVVRAWSMYEFVPSDNESGSDHFFSTFGKYGAISGREHGRMLADVRRRAASENVMYIEPMLTSNSTARSLGQNLWSSMGGGTFSEAGFGDFHAALLADPGFDNARDSLIDNADQSEQFAQLELGCEDTEPDNACDVEARYQAYISRSGSHQGVFAQMIAAYEAAALEPRIVGLNLVGPEGGSAAMSNYDRQMAMLGYLNDYYEGVSPLRLSLHAGEITTAAIPNNYTLNEISHVRKAVETAGARRIGHGVDIMSEQDPDQLFEMLRDRSVLVEICLASNDIILEVSGDAHPVHEYLARGVPVSLATDDQAVARSSLAAEFLRAVADQGLDYLELKLMVRASLEYSFLTGQSLWVDGEIQDACAPTPGNTLATEQPSTPCLEFLAANDRAGLQFDLELQLEQFELGYLD